MTLEAGNGDQRLITCILPKGRGLEVVRRLHDEKGIDTGNVANGRGAGMAEGDAFGSWVEVVMVTVIVSAEREPEVFEFIYDIADVGRVHGGIMFTTRLAAARSFDVPEIPPAEPLNS